MVLSQIFFRRKSMKELHALVDFENVQPSLDALAKLAPGFTDVWLFHGPHQAKRAQVYGEVLLNPNPGWAFRAVQDLINQLFPAREVWQKPLAAAQGANNDDCSIGLAVHLN